MSDQDRLRDAIQRLHGCQSHHVESVAVTETFRGKTVWQGTVEVFDLVGHPKASRCYAWSHQTDAGGEKFYAVLALPPVDSPRKAVQAAVAADARKSP
jgi:hypothetical protein